MMIIEDRGISPPLLLLLFNSCCHPLRCLFADRVCLSVQTSHPPPHTRPISTPSHLFRHFVLCCPRRESRAVNPSCFSLFNVSQQVVRDDRDGEAEEEEEEEEEGAGNCLVALARHHWARLPVSETGPARDQLLEVCLAAHERVRTSRGRRSVLSALRHVASSVDGELEWPGVVARLKQAFDASVKGWTSDKPVPAPLVDSVHAVYAVVRRYEFPNSEETIWDEAPDVLDDMVEKLVRPMVKRVLVAVMRDRGNGGARVPRAAWTQEKKKQAPESAAVAPAQVQATASSKSSGSGNEGKEATAAAAAGAGFFVRAAAPPQQ